MSKEAGAFRLFGLVPDVFSDKRLAAEKNNLISKFLKTPPLEAYEAHSEKPDRYRRKAAIFTHHENDRHVQLQQLLIKSGLARVQPEGLDTNCAKQWLLLEEAARHAERGLWKLPTYRVKNAANLHLSAIVSTYQIVSGVVTSVHRSEKGTSYLNFGDDWSHDFTVSLNEKSLRMWEAKNKKLDDLLNEPIYVRGWVEKRGGPLIPVTQCLSIA